MRKSIFILLTALFIFNSSSFVLAEENPLEQTEQKIAAASEALPAVLKNVTAIEVTGNKAISTNVIISKMKTRVGSAYQENIISDDLKRLYLLGFFSDIKIDTQDYKDGLKILISVVERPIIEKISFSGINLITMKDEKLKQQLKSKETQYLDYPSLAEDVRILKKMYEKMGYSQADISYKVDANTQANKASIVFTAVEGRKVRIKDIRIEGNNNFSSGRILKLLKTKRAWFFNAGVLKDEVLTEDIARVKSFYQREGFTDAAVDYVVKPDAQKPYLLFITIKVTEGKKYLVGSVMVQGNKDVSEKEILKTLTDCIPGKVFSQEAMKKDLTGIQGLYFDRGYISAQVQESTIVNTDSGRVDITYAITENQVVYVDKIKIRGNIKTKDLVIRREMRIHPGEKFDGEKLRRSKERLTNLGFFEEVSYDTEETGQPAKKNLVVDVKETKTGSFSFGGGYSTVDQFIGFVEVEQKNFDWRNWPYFTGAGQNLKVRASVGNLSQGFELSFTEPWMFDYPVSFGFDLYRRTHDRDTDTGYGYDETVTGGDLRLGKEISEYLRGDLTYRLDQIEISNISDNSPELKDEEGTNVISVISPSLTYDSRDNVFDTRKGNLLTGSFDFAGLGGDKSYLKFFGRASHYFPMPRGAVFEVRGRLGLAQPYGDTEKLPIYERFFAGGAYTIRGYEERGVGPVDVNSKDPLGGASLAVGNIEYTYPLFSFLKVAAFYDVGNVWEKLGDIFSNKDANGVENSGGFKSALGLGLRIKTPIGPIMLDYGIPMDKQSGESSKKSGGRFHFSASHGF
ncbi:MAG: outer membrane protein assembly factor BamA [Candidatus Omnitrophica bacterium]|nr:outer membrane protein assembly factor BamA [Candidatus Omnitrophota bacterium]MBU4419219.1 outer membrane protein assembly factor BamA [Candidatus Omnitrophota bacterium]MBU4468237.1 outer membrane protein assembly factor BamA [Candidatus Omnitrophota bacterium]MCG2707245.1 outer membrane protein assembly factor BamA [Candidatus Omnitrophota bacterium]